MSENAATICISYPLPLRVSGALLQLIGAAWPGCMLNTQRSDALVISLPSTTPEDVSDEQATAIVAAADQGDDYDAEIGSFNMATGEVTLLTKPGVWENLGVWAAAALGFAEEDTSPDAFPSGINYAETTMTYAGEAFAVIAARGGRTPGALRQSAERRAEKAELRAKIAEADVARYVERYGPLPPSLGAVPE